MISYLQVENLSKSFGENQLFNDVSFTLHKNQKLALIAKNGIGKSTLLNIITGKDVQDTGKITFKKDLKIAYLEQIPKFVLDDNIIDHIFRSSDNISNIIKEYEKAIISEDTNLIQKATEQMDIAEAWDYEFKIKEILSKLEIAKFNKKIKTLSGGEKRRLALAAALIEKSDILILDEPTNHLDLQMIEWLERYLKKEKLSLVMVTHDRYFLDNICNEIVEIDMKSSFLYKGNYQYYLEKRNQRINILQADIDKANNLYKKELEWMRKMPQARTTKAKYRIDNFYKIEKRAKINIQEDEQNIDIKTARLGKKVLDIYNISKSFDDRLLINDFSQFERDKHYNYVSKLSGGERKRLYLMTILMKNPNFLILDEPTNDFDIQTLTALEEYIKNFNGNVLIVSHDRYFMDKIVDSLFVFEENGKISNFPGNYDDYRHDKQLKDQENKKQAKQNNNKKENRKIIKKKFGFNEQREFKQLEIDLKKYEERKKLIENEMNSGNLKEEQLLKHAEEYKEIDRIIDEKEMRWLELSELID